MNSELKSRSLVGRLNSWLALRRARRQVEQWLGSCSYDDFVADARVHHLCQLIRQSHVNSSELSVALDAILEKLTSGVETFPEESMVSLDVLASFAGVICDAIGDRQLLVAEHVAHRRMAVWLGFAHSQVRYYQRLVSDEGSGWVRGLERAEQFRVLMEGDRPDPAALDEFINLLEQEYRSEGSAYWLMLAGARGAAETARQTAA